MTTQRSTNPSTRNAMKSLLNSFLSLFAALALLGLPNHAAAQSASPPERMSYQGFLADANGNPLGSTEPANYRAVFSIWPTSSGGLNRWPIFGSIQLLTIRT